MVISRLSDTRTTATPADVSAAQAAANAYADAAVAAATAGVLAPDWASGTRYVAGQLVTFGQGLYRAKTTFIAGASFDVSNWTLVNNNPFGLISSLADPMQALSAQTISGPRTLYLRCLGAGVITSLAVEVTTSSGNISMAAYRNSGTGRSATPGTQIFTTGSVACPAAGYAALSLGGSYGINQGDWLALSCDNATAAFRCAGSAQLNNALWAGRAAHESVHPAPTTPSPTNGNYRGVLLVGIP